MQEKGSQTRKWLRYLFAPWVLAAIGLYPAWILLNALYAPLQKPFHLLRGDPQNPYQFQFINDTATIKYEQDTTTKVYLNFLSTSITLPYQDIILKALLEKHRIFLVGKHFLYIYNFQNKRITTYQLPKEYTFKTIVSGDFLQKEEVALLFSAPRKGKSIIMVLDTAGVKSHWEYPILFTSFALAFDTDKDNKDELLANVEVPFYKDKSTQCFLFDGETKTIPLAQRPIGSGYSHVSALPWQVNKKVYLVFLHQNLRQSKTLCKSQCCWDDVNFRKYSEFLWITEQGIKDYRGESCFQLSLNEEEGRFLYYSILLPQKDFKTLYVVNRYPEKVRILKLYFRGKPRLALVNEFSTIDLDAPLSKLHNYQLYSLYGDYKAVQWADLDHDNYWEYIFATTEGIYVIDDNWKYFSTRHFDIPLRSVPQLSIGKDKKGQYQILVLTGTGKNLLFTPHLNPIYHLRWLVLIGLYGALTLLLWGIQQLHHHVREQFILELERKVEEQTRQINESINAATKVQAALIPPSNYLSRFTPSYFLYLKQCEKVGGDFWWCSNKGRRYLLAGDCLGHGIPAALMVAICISSATQAILSSENPTPASILQFIIDALRKTFQYRGRYFHEGMEGMVMEQEKERLKIATWGWPVYLIAPKPLRLYHQKNVLIQEQTAFLGSARAFSRVPYPIWRIMPKTKQQIMQFEVDKSAVCALFVTSDGILDQLGGAKRRKFGIKNTVRLLYKIYLTHPKQRKAMTVATLNKWMELGNCTAVDDRIILGLFYQPPPFYLS